jgi:hypothetical protein
VEGGKENAKVHKKEKSFLVCSSTATAKLIAKFTK